MIPALMFFVKLNTAFEFMPRLVGSELGIRDRLDADAAKKAGMVDRVESFEATIARLLSDRPKVKRRLAHAKNFLSSC